MAGDMRPKDMKRGMNMVFEAIRKGYDHWVGSLELRSEELGYDVPKNRHVHYCWAYQGAKYQEAPADLTFVVHINKSPQDQRPALEGELNELRRWHPSIEDCIQLTQQNFGE